MQPPGFQQIEDAIRAACPHGPSADLDARIDELQQAAPPAGRQQTPHAATRPTRQAPHRALPFRSAAALLLSAVLVAGAAGFVAGRWTAPAIQPAPHPLVTPAPVSGGATAAASPPVRRAPAPPPHYESIRRPPLLAAGAVLHARPVPLPARPAAATAVLTETAPAEESTEPPLLLLQPGAEYVDLNDIRYH